MEQSIDFEEFGRQCGELYRSLYEQAQSMNAGKVHTKMLLPGGGHLYFEVAL